MLKLEEIYFELQPSLLPEGGPPSGRPSFVQSLEPGCATVLKQRVQGVSSKTVQAKTWTSDYRQQHSTQSPRTACREGSWENIFLLQKEKLAQRV